MQRVATPMLVFGFLIGLYLYAMKNLQSIFTEYGFVDSRERMEVGSSDSLNVATTSLATASYQGASREAEAFVWEKLNQAQPFQYSLEHCTVRDCVVADILEEKIPLHTMHTQLQETIIPLENNLGQQRKRKRKRATNTQQQPNGHDDEYDFGLPAVKWLGDSLINRLVREAIAATLEQSSIGKIERFSVLDVGSGLSGMLYSILDLPFREWTYLGISISQPEVIRAEQLLDLHKLSQSISSLKNVTIRQASFDEPLPAKSFHSIVAVESLGYSQNITKTIANIAGALAAKGSLIIVEDVVSSWAEESDDIGRLVDVSAKHSLLTHNKWKTELESAGLMFQQAPRDLTLEFDWAFPSESEKPFSVVRESVRWLSRWHGRGAVDSWNRSGTGARAIHLLSDLIERSNANFLRQAMHRKAELTLMMYTCTKK